VSTGRVTALLLLVLGCATGEPPTEPPTGIYPGTLVPTGDIAGNFLMRQRIDYRYGDAVGSFEAAIQKRCEELTVVGFTPFGTLAFSIRQRDLEVEVESRMPGPWPFPLRFVLIDVHRSFFLPTGSDPPHSGERKLPFGEETIEETWRNGRLLERSFRRNSGEPAGRIVVRYAGEGTAPGRARHVELENGWFGYRLDIRVLSRAELDCEAAAPAPPSSRRDLGLREWLGRS
jgi:hypothetical protein